MRDPDAKRMMLKVAQNYEALARRIVSLNGHLWIAAVVEREPTE
jgi:hypothetical protein